MNRPKMVAEVDSRGVVGMRRIAHREAGASQERRHAKNQLGAARKEVATKDHNVDGPVMLGGVLVHNYDLKQAPGSDAAQFIENGGNLADWVGEVSRIWIDDVKKGVTKASLNEICARVGRVRLRRGPREWNRRVHHQLH